MARSRCSTATAGGAVAVVGAWRSGPPTLYADSSRPSCVVVADMNGDGRLDLVVGHQSGDVVSVALGTAEGTVRWHQPGYTELTCHTAPVSVAVGDLDGDGRPDIVVCSQFAALIDSMLNRTDDRGLLGLRLGH